MATIRDQVNTEMQRLRRRDRGCADPPRRPAGGEHPGDPVAHAVGTRSASPPRHAPRAPRRPQRIRADAERDRTVLLAEARATADRLRGEGEAEATPHLRQGLQQDPGFFTHLAHPAGATGRRSTAGNARLVLTPDNDFLRYLQTVARRRPPPAAIAVRRQRLYRRVTSQPRALPRPCICRSECLPRAAYCRLIRRETLIMPPLPLRAAARAALLRPSCVLAAAAVPAPRPSTPAYARAAPDSFADLAAKLLPAVVNISSTQTVQAAAARPAPGRRCRCSRPARRSSSSSRTSSTATARAGRPGGDGPAAAASGGRRASAPASSSTPSGYRRDQQPRDRRRRRDHRHPAGQHHAEGQAASGRDETRRPRAAAGEDGQAAAGGAVRRFRHRRGSATGCWRSAIRSASAAR